MASPSSQKRKERAHSPFEGESSSSSTQDESIIGRPAFPLRDPWYTPSLFFPQVSHGETPPSPHTWIRRGLREAVPIFFDFVAGKIQGWPIWVDKELSDEEFVGRLECAGVLKAVAISRNLEGFRDTKVLRHLVCRWSPSLHTFSFSVGELTVTLEDVVNNFLLLVLGDENPFDINLSDEDLEVEEKLFAHFGGRTASSGGKLARMGRWVMSLSREKDKEVRRAGFLAFWLSKFLFSEFPGYRIKSTLFPLAIKLAQGAQYPLAPMFLGHVYSQLDQLHGDEAEGDSCYVITSSLHCAILQAFSYWSRRSPQFVVPNFQRGVFASSGYAGYWRRVQKSFVNYAGSNTIGQVPNPGFSSAPTSNKRLSLPIAGVVSTAVSSKTGFVE
nr:hypothetical protein CFP56_27764 [Quercus suber]